MDGNLGKLGKLGIFGILKILGILGVFIISGKLGIFWKIRQLCKWGISGN